MSGDFAAKFIWACALPPTYSPAGEIYSPPQKKKNKKIVKMDLTNLRRKNSSQMFDQSKCKYISIFAFAANTSDLAANDMRNIHLQMFLQPHATAAG